MEDLKTKLSGVIRNPLAVIAMFATLSEVAMVLTLPHLPPAPQLLFVWFAMGFPILLVIGFFVVLYRKPAVLFSPGDYNDPQHYLDSINTVRSEHGFIARVEGLEGSVKVLQTGLDQLAENTPGGKKLKESFAEQRERLQELRSLKENNLYEFLTNEIELEEKIVISIIKESNKIEELPEIILKLTNNNWKSKRIIGIINNFPDTIRDYEKLKEIVFHGD